MAAYDPKRPRPAQLAEDAAPVDALLEPPSPTPSPEPRPGAATPSEPTVLPDPSPEVSESWGPRSNEVPVAPAPEVGTTNRAVLYAALGVATLVTAVLVALRIRARRAAGPDAG